MATFTMQNSVMSSVRILAYLDYTPTAIKARAAIPDQSAMVLGATYVDCYKIDNREIADVLGAAYTSTIQELSEHPSVNHFSHFAPTEWWDNSGTIEPKLKATVTKDNFAGYHHDAVAPYVVSSTNDYYPDDPQQSSITANLYIGEIDWEASIGAKWIRMSSYVGGIIKGYVDVSIESVALGLVTLTVNPTMDFISNQLIESEVYFLDVNNVVIGLVPEIGTINTNFIATAITMDFTSTAGEPQYQSFTVNTAADNWTVVSKPEWITCAVYRGGVYVPHTYISGDELRVYPASTNTGLNRIGSVVLSEMVQIDVIQQGGTPTVQFVSQSMVLSEESATLVVNGTVVPFTFRVVSGISEVDAEAITIQMYKDGVGWIGDQTSKNTRAGLLVNGQLAGFLTTDIVNGHAYTIYVETFV